MQKRFFRNLVITSFIKSLTLSVTGLIDCAVVGHCLGTDGLSAMKLAMPVFSILSLFSFVLSTGFSVTVSKELSANGGTRANAIFRSVFTVICIIGVCICAAGLVYPSVLTDFFAGSSCDPAVKAQTADYLRPILIGAPAILLYDVLGTAAMLGGATRYLKLSAAALFLTDLVGDFLAVALNGGMLGIAAASAAAYAAALVCILLYFFQKRSLFRLGLCRPDHTVLGKVVLLGLPAGVTLFCKVLMPLAVNRLILSYGTIPGLAALSVQDTVRYVPGALCLGISDATLILTGLFAAEYDLPSLKQENVSIKRWSYIGGTAAAAVLMILASPILRIFTSDPDVHSLGVRSLLLYLPSVPFIAINASVVSFLQALGRKWHSICFAVFDYLISPVFFAWLLARRFGDLGIYASFTVSEIFTTVMITVILWSIKHRKASFLAGSLLDTEIDASFTMSISSLEQAASASRQVNTLCLENGFGNKQAFFVSLAVEELAVNSITHGFSDNRDHHMELRVVIAGDRLVLRLRDDGRPFDLTERYRMINPDDPTRNIGLRIIFACADDISYNSSLNLNNVYFRIIREPSPKA